MDVSNHFSIRKDLAHHLIKTTMKEMDVLSLGFQVKVYIICNMFLLVSWGFCMIHTKNTCRGVCTVPCQDGIFYRPRNHSRI